MQNPNNYVCSCDDLSAAFEVAHKKVQKDQITAVGVVEEQEFLEAGFYVANHLGPKPLETLAALAYQAQGVSASWRIRSVNLYSGPCFYPTPDGSVNGRVLLMRVEKG